jgi:hypothetical protein
MLIASSDTVSAAAGDRRNRFKAETCDRCGSGPLRPRRTRPVRSGLDRLVRKKVFNCLAQEVVGSPPRCCGETIQLFDLVRFQVDIERHAQYVPSSRELRRLGSA